MKITILGPAHPYRGGIAELNERLAEQLQLEGHDVNIVTFTIQYPEFIFPGKTQYKTDPPEFNINIKRQINSINPLNWILTGNKIKRTKPDLVIVRFWLPFMAPSLGTICRIIRKNKTTRVIAIVDNMIPHEKRVGDRLFSKYFTKSVDGFIAMSKSVLKDISIFDSKKPKKFTPHPVYNQYGKIEQREAALKKINLSKENRYVLFFGFIRDYKGLDLLLSAFSDPYFLKSNIKLIVAGEFYSNEKKYMDLIHELGIMDRVILRTDYIPENEVRNYFNACDLVAQPYKSATQSGVTQIGYHFHKPMLVTNVGGLSEIIPHMKAGYVVEPVHNKISESIIDFFENSRANSFIKNIIVEKKRFDWDKMTHSIYELNKTIANE